MTFTQDLKEVSEFDLCISGGRMVQMRKELVEKSKGESMANMKDKEGGQCSQSGWSDGESIEKEVR